MIHRLLTLLCLFALASCQRPPKPAPPQPKVYQSKENSMLELRLAPPNPLLSAKAPVSITTSGPVEAAPESLEFTIDLTKIQSQTDIFLQELAKPHQFGSAPTISFQSESIEETSSGVLQIQGKWTFEGTSKPATIPATWSMDGSRMKLKLTPVFRLRDYRPLPKDAPKQVIDPRFQLNIESTLSPTS